MRRADSLDPALVERIKSYTDVADRVVAAACDRLIRNNARWSSWEVEQGLLDVLQISKGGDCCYDRPSIGVSYALWFHGRRVHDALRLLGLTLSDRERPLRIVDLGSGTGATVCAVAVFQAAVRDAGATPAPIVVDAVEQSPFMRQAWAEITTAFLAETHLRPGELDVTLASRWADIKVRHEDTVIFAGHLLDHSDRAHVPELASCIRDLADRTQPQSVLLATSSAKHHTLEAIKRNLGYTGWRCTTEPRLAPLWSASTRLDYCHRRRSSWYEQYAPRRRALWRKAPTMYEPRDECVSTALTPGSARDPSGSPLLGLDAVWSTDADQERAATPDRKLTVIAGPAGSGKTVALAERVARTAERHAGRPGPARILVTTHNRKVIELLADLMRERLGGHRTVDRIDDRGKDGLLRGVVLGPKVARGDRRTDRDWRIDLLHRDRLPHIVLGMKWPGQCPDWQRAITERRAERPEIARHLPERVTDEFLEEELYRVILARDCRTLDDYLRPDVRRGRGARPRIDTPSKRAIWKLLTSPLVDSFATRRYNAFRFHEDAIRKRTQQLEVAREAGWTHVFVDECQDLAPHEFLLLARIPPTPANLCVAGDPSQAFRLGKSYHLPSQGIGARWVVRRLRGSYRVPLRICEALEPLDERGRAARSRVRDEDDRHDMLPILPRKLAEPGPRPIAVASETAASDLVDILGTYAGWVAGDRRVLFADSGSDDLLRAARYSGWTTHSERAEAFKGLEWPCVVVATSTCHGSSEAEHERILTALTRTRCLLILVLHPVSPGPENDVDPSPIGRLRPDRVLPWTKDAHSRFTSLGEAIMRYDAAGHATSRDADAQADTTVAVRTVRTPPSLPWTSA